MRDTARARRRWPQAGLALVLAMATALAGCTATPIREVDDVAGAPALQATATTGVLRGIVFDEAIQPVAQAEVAVRGTSGTPRTGLTDEAGFFGFAGLEPGTYFVTVSKPTFSSLQQGVEVLAGVDEPPLVKLQIARIPSEQPFLTKVQVEAFVQCIVPGANLCAIVNLYPCATVGYCTPLVEDTSHVFLYDELVGPQRVPDWFQSEMVWQSTQPLSPDLAARVSPRSPDDGAGVDERQLHLAGPSPLVAALNRTALTEWDVGLAEGVGYEIFGHFEPAAAIGSAGVVLNQRVSFYFDVFYGYVPPDGWQFSVDGTFPPPA